LVLNCGIQNQGFKMQTTVHYYSLSYNIIIIMSICGSITSILFTLYVVTATMWHTIISYDNRVAMRVAGKMILYRHRYTQRLVFCPFIWIQNVIWKTKYIIVVLQFTLPKWQIVQCTYIFLLSNGNSKYFSQTVNLILFVIYT